MKESVFEFSSYKSYLLASTGGKSARRGEKMALARASKCQPTYISQVLYGKAELSLEQAERLNHYFAHGKEEALYFLLLVQKGRAGTQPLRNIFEAQLEDMLAKRLDLTERLGKKTTLGLEEQATYYSSWQYAAVHIALTIPRLQTKESLSRYLSVPKSRIIEILDFLESVGLAQKLGSKYGPGESEIRLGKDSPNIIKLHSNWRLRAIESLERESVSELHYSGVVSLSREDALTVKSIFLEAIRESTAKIRASKEEELRCISIDFFSVEKSPIEIDA